MNEWNSRWTDIEQAEHWLRSVLPRSEPVATAAVKAAIRAELARHPVRRRTGAPAWWGALAAAAVLALCAVVARPPRGPWSEAAAPGTTMELFDGALDVAEPVDPGVALLSDELDQFRLVELGLDDELDAIAAEIDQLLVEPQGLFDSTESSG